jgi:hypothetical protein
MKKIIVCLFVIALMGVNCLAQTLKTGTTAAPVLKMNVGPRAIGMGGAFAAEYADLYSLYWNPAGIAGITGNEAGFVHSNLYADIRHDYAGFVTGIDGFGSLGAFVTVLSMDEMKVRTLEKPEGTGEMFSAGSVVIGVSYARNLTDHFSIGFNAEYISDYLYNMRASGFAIDAGTLYKIPVLNELRIASSISNFGTKMKLEGRDIIVITPSGSGGSNLINSYLEVDEFSLPLLFRFGVAADVVKEEDYMLTAAIDAIHPNDHSEYVNLGVEYAWKNFVFLRAGYNSLFETDTEKGLTLGFGIDYKVIDLVALRVDYAYQSFGRLKNIQYFSLGVAF